LFLLSSSLVVILPALPIALAILAVLLLSHPQLFLVVSLLFSPLLLG
jgi:hypothetical protein